MAATILLLTGMWHPLRAQQRPPDNEAAHTRVIDTCADGAVNGLVTVSIAATVALFAEIVLPTYPVLFTIGPTVGCPVRIIGERLKLALLP